MTADGQNPQDSLGGSPQEERLGELINEYFDRIEGGEKLSKEQFLTEHPECANELREHLGGLDLIAGMGSSVGGRTLPGQLAPAPRGSSATDQFATAPPVLPVITGYDVHKLIGRGGMGLVYKATQTSTKRVVALKLLMEGPFASDGARKRFEREIALAAQLRHPNIIPIYDSGTSDGRMFYAMEHVYGMSLTDYVRANTPDLKSRLRLFSKVCMAVSHAHLRGVIHRDLKPTNILVDGAGEPHILDFGLAKAGTFGDMTTSATAQIVGTPAYMSPEQASGDPGGIDIRTDVYSLGMILYEMLTMQLPYETNVSMGKILHNIAHAEPKPPNRINSKIDSDLTAVVLKALEKNKDTRYQSVDGLSSDIQRHLAGEPVTAKPPSGLYLLKKVLIKHKLVVGASALLILIGVTGFFVVSRFTTNLAVKEQRLREQTEENRKQAEERARLQQELTNKQAAIEAEEQRKIKAQQDTEVILRSLTPENRKLMEELTKDASAGFTPDALMQLLARKVVAGLDAEQRQVPQKSIDFDPAESFGSEKIKRPPTNQIPPVASDEHRKERESLESAAKLFLQRFSEYQAELAQGAAASQPASLPQPTASAPATTSAPAKS